MCNCFFNKPENSLNILLIKFHFTELIFFCFLFYYLKTKGYEIILRKRSVDCGNGWADAPAFSNILESLKVLTQKLLELNLFITKLIFLPRSCIEWIASSLNEALPPLNVIICHSFISCSPVSFYPNWFYQLEIKFHLLRYNILADKFWQDTILIGKQEKTPLLCAAHSTLIINFI